MTENALTPEESLKLITDTISRTREDMSKNSFYFLLWGWFVTIASFLFFILQNYTSTKLYFIPFPVSAIAGTIITLIYAGRQGARQPETYLAYFLKRVWLVLGICFFIVVFINVSHGQQPFTYTLLLGGIGTLISGLVTKFRPLLFGGILFLAATIACTYVAENYQALLHGIAIILGYLVPGYLLKTSKS